MKTLCHSRLYPPVRDHEFSSPPSIQSHSAFLSKKLPLSRRLKLEIQVIGTERSDQVRPVCSILEPGRNPRSSPGQAELIA
jgi:hypothetical protein